MDNDWYWREARRRKDNKVEERTLTKHEALPSEVPVLEGIGNLWGKINGDWDLRHIECFQVGLVVIPGISAAQCACVVTINLLVYIVDLVFIDKIHDVVRWLGDLTASARAGFRRGRLGLGSIPVGGEVAVVWVALSPLLGACLDFNGHLEQGFGESRYRAKRN